MDFIKPPVLYHSGAHCTLFEKYIKTLTGYVIMLEFYSAIRKNETMWFEGMQLEDIMLSEGSQIQKDKACIFSLKCERQIQR
jgi:hypothetical protein